MVQDTLKIYIVLLLSVQFGDFRAAEDEAKLDEFVVQIEAGHEDEIYRRMAMIDYNVGRRVKFRFIFQ